MRKGDNLILGGPGGPEKSSCVHGTHTNIHIIHCKNMCITRAKEPGWLDSNVTSLSKRSRP